MVRRTTKPKVRPKPKGPQPPMNIMPTGLPSGPQRSGPAVGSKGVGLTNKKGGAKKRRR